MGFYAPGHAPGLPLVRAAHGDPGESRGRAERSSWSARPAADGHVPAVKLAAAAIAGADRVFAASGAQAIAALAYGTETIPRVDKICGPGNIFVTLAKRDVFGDVGIDSIYGPTETVVVADDDADPRLRRRPHRPGRARRAGGAGLHHDSLALAERVVAEVEARLAVLPRGAIARAAFETNGAAPSSPRASKRRSSLASEFAPEHLCLLAKDARRLGRLVKNAGGIFIGEGSPEAIGDYTAAPATSCRRAAPPASLRR